MSTKTISWIGLAAATAVIGLGIYAISRSYKDEETVEPKASEGKVDTDTTKHDVDYLSRSMLISSAAMYRDLQNDTTLTEEIKKEKFEALMVSLVEAHLTVNDCTQDENRTYVKWLRDMRIENPAFWERVIRKSNDTGAVGVKAIYAVVVAIKFAGVTKPVEAIALSVSDLTTCLTVEDAIKSGLDIPEGNYKVTVETIVDIPSKVVFLSETHRVVITESV